MAHVTVPHPKSGARMEPRPPAPRVKANPATKEFLESANPCPTPDSLFKLCDLDWVYEHFKDDFRLKLILAEENIKEKVPEKSYGAISALADEQGIPAQINSPESLSTTIDKVHTRAALYSTM